MSQSGESPDFAQRIVDILRKNERPYLASDAVYNALGRKSFAAIAGPMNSGKTTASNEAICTDQDLYLVNSTLTRRRRASDPLEYRTADEGVTYAEFETAVTQRSLVNVNVIGDQLVGTYPTGFPGEYNIGPIVMRSVDAFIQSGFKRFDIGYMIVNSDTYEERLRQEPTDAPNYTTRLLESQESLKFAKRNLGADWITCIESSSEPDSAAKAARKIIHLVRGHSTEMMSHDTADQYIDGMLDTLQKVARRRTL